MLETATKVLEKIESYGYKAYIVGGYPRDLYLKRSSTDIDICTDATPAEIISIFSTVVTTNFEYGSVVISYKKIKFEITTFRAEGNYKNRKPTSIKYIDSLEEDLKRRDFTINTLCIDKNGDMIDLINAKSDLDGKIVRMIGNPKMRLKEDPLRILRAIRLATVLDFELEPVLKAYIKKYNFLLKKISRERRKEELDVIFSSSNKEYGIKLLCELKLVDSLEIPKLSKIKITPSMIVTWEELDVLDKYNFTSNERQMILKIKEMENKNLLDSKVLYQYGLYACTLACELTDISKKELNKVYSLLPIHSKLDIAIKPAEICLILDKKPDKFLKDIINDLENQILTGTLQNQKSILQKYIEDKYKHTFK